MPGRIFAGLLLGIFLAFPPPTKAQKFEFPGGSVDIGEDVRNPGNILRNIGREGEKSVRDGLRPFTEAELELNGRAFEQWLIQSRDSAASGGVYPIPPHIRDRLRGFYEDDILNRALFKVGDAGIANLANLSINYGEAAAVTLINVIVFSNADNANNPSIWAHELKHIQQFRDWGSLDFAKRYLRDYQSVEGDAYAAQNNYASFRPQPPLPSSGGIFPPPPPVGIANFCNTSAGSCPMGVVIPIGSPCQCNFGMSFAPGVAR